MKREKIEISDTAKFEEKQSKLSSPPKESIIKPKNAEKTEKTSKPPPKIESRGNKFEKAMHKSNN